jgi:hypothetical protein
MIIFESVFTPCEACFILKIAGAVTKICLRLKSLSLPKLAKHTVDYRFLSRTNKNFI